MIAIGQAQAPAAAAVQALPAALTANPASVASHSNIASMTTLVSPSILGPTMDNNTTVLTLLMRILNPILSSKSKVMELMSLTPPLLTLEESTSWIPNSDLSTILLSAPATLYHLPAILFTIFTALL